MFDRAKAIELFKARYDSEEAIANYQSNAEELEFTYHCLRDILIQETITASDGKLSEKWVKGYLHTRYLRYRRAQAGPGGLGSIPRDLWDK